MAVVTTEIELTSSLPPPKLFKVFNDFDTIAPKVEPETYKTVTTIEGDGGVGTIKTMTYGDGVPFTSSKHKVDTVDAKNFSFSYTIFEGDVLLSTLNSVTHHIKFLPSADGGSVYKHTVELKCKDDNKLPEENINILKEALKKTFKGFEAYGVAHPEAY